MKKYKLHVEFTIFVCICVFLYAQSYQGDSPSIMDNSNPTSIYPAPARVVVVVVAIPNGYGGFAADSHRAYCEKHNYRLVVQRDWRGTVPQPTPRKAVRIQKLLGCTHVRKNEEFVLVIDKDVVIAPWAPPVHVYADANVTTNGKLGIVDEDQPTQDIYQAVLRHRTGADAIVTPQDYYRQYGYEHSEKHGILNGGVVFYRVNGKTKNGGTVDNCDWMQNLYYKDSTQEFVSVNRGHYDQPVLGVALLKENRYQRMDHRWNRLWAYYSFSAQVGGPEYDLWKVYKDSYFMHFCWKKKSLDDLEKLMKLKNVTFFSKSDTNHRFHDLRSRKLKYL